MLTNRAPWLNGLMASGILSQELEAEIAQTGGQSSCAQILHHTCSIFYVFRPMSSVISQAGSLQLMT
jgi:hypothetical protein